MGIKRLVVLTVDVISVHMIFLGKYIKVLFQTLLKVILFDIIV